MKVIDVEPNDKALSVWDAEGRRAAIWEKLVAEPCPLRRERGNCHHCMGRAPQGESSLWSCFWYACPRIVEDDHAES